MKVTHGAQFEAMDCHGMEVMARETWRPVTLCPWSGSSGVEVSAQLMVFFLSSLVLPQLSLSGNSLTDTSRSTPTLPYPIGNSQSHPIDREG